MGLFLECGVLQIMPSPSLLMFQRSVVGIEGEQGLVVGAFLDYGDDSMYFVDGGTLGLVFVRRGFIVVFVRFPAGASRYVHVTR